MLKVTVRDAATSPGVGGTGVQEVLVDGKLFFKTLSSVRAREVAKVLDAALNRPLQLYDITRKGASVLVRGQTIVTVEASDAPGTPPDAQAEAASRALKSALYRYILEGAY
jgi:hypothetical protein